MRRVFGFTVALSAALLIASASAHTDCEQMMANYDWDNTQLGYAADSLASAQAQLQWDYNNNVSQEQLDTDVNVYNGAYGMYQGWVGAVDSDLAAMHEAHCM
jgi:hypothetical protein